MTDVFIEYEGNKLFYFKYGNGEKCVLLFHGFGQDHSAFDSWTNSLENEFTIYSFDLFFHGKSEWVNEEVLSKEDWIKILGIFFQKENIQAAAVAGFSLGAKFALATLESYPELVREIILIAPDGVKLNFWYKVATSSSLMRFGFKIIITYPQPFFDILKALNFLRITDKFLLRFAHSQMNTEEKRKKVYNSWICFRGLNFKLKSIAEQINHFGIAVTIVMGKYDKVIPVKRVKSFVHLIPQGKFYILEAGHNDLIKQSIYKIRTLSDSQH